MTVYIVLKNSDLSEGRGPMIIDKVFEHFRLADEYIRKFGIELYGHIDETFVPTQDRTSTGSRRWNYSFHEIREEKVYDHKYEEQLLEHEKQTALRKLTDRERKLLGL